MAINRNNSNRGSEQVLKKRIIRIRRATTHIRREET